jgi:hypothetical protein
MNLMRVKLLGKHLTLFLSLMCAFSTTSYASWLSQATSGGRTLEQVQAEREMKAKEMGDEALLRLVRFRGIVEKNAYETTMRLCAGYQMARGVKPSTYHKKNMYTLAETSSAWVDIFNHGLRQPFSSMVGIKGDYLDISNVPMLSTEYWLQSLYVMYLLNSTGFLQASVHCLNTLEHDEIFYFALAIAEVDVQATVLAELGLFITGEAVISIIVRSAKWVFRPAARLAKIVKSRVTKTHWRVAGVIVIPILADSLMAHLRNVEVQKKAINGMVDDLLNDPQAEGRAQRLITLNTAFGILKETLEQDTTKEAAGTAGVFKDYISQNFDGEKISYYIEDFKRLKTKESLQGTDKLYFALLELMVPIIQKNMMK